MTVYEYLTDPGGKVHLVPQYRALQPNVRTVCGARTRTGWVFGDETPTGVAATCEMCKRVVNRRRAS